VTPDALTSSQDGLIRVTVNHAAGRIPVIAGTGANSTDEAIELTEYAKRAGAAMALSVVPYYNKPTQACGLVRINVERPFETARAA
jgi:dihydrodipicolinate synthase/N-acetylneuraminate lyase